MSIGLWDSPCAGDGMIDAGHASTILVGTGAAVLIILLFCVAAHDLRWMTIPNSLNALLLGAGLIFAGIMPQPGWWAAMSGILAGAAVMGALAGTFEMMQGRAGLGFGDVKFVASAGAWVGWSGLPPLILLASISALLFIGARRLADPSYDIRSRLPFGPFLAASTLTTWMLQMHDVAFW